MSVRAVASRCGRTILPVCLAVLMCACGSTPTREQSELIQLARQADLNFQAGRFDLSRKQYEQLVSANPKFIPGHLRLGVLAYRDGDTAVARERFELAARLDPSNGQAKYNLAMLHLNEATQLLSDYARLSSKGNARQDVLLLLSHLREFGGK